METISALLQRLSFPQDSREQLLQNLAKLDKTALAGILAPYEQTENCNYPRMLEEMQLLCANCGIREYCANMLLFLCLAPALKRCYAQRGIPEHIFYDSLMDLRYKLEECRLVKGELGTFVPHWYTGFFDLTRFALGRLQFELKPLKTDCIIDGIPLSAESTAINIHIPRTGTRLDHNLVLDSYRLAASFFADAFGDRPTVFTCHSWMLYPWNITILSPDSNMAAFYRDFQIVESGDHPDYRDAWRLFDCPYDGDPHKLPTDTSLRRAYVRRIREGKPLGWGRGVFIYK